VVRTVATAHLSKPLEISLSKLDSPDEGVSGLPRRPSTSHGEGPL